MSLYTTIIPAKQTNSDRIRDQPGLPVHEVSRIVVCISPHLPRFQVGRRSRGSIDSERKQKNTHNTNKV